MSNYQLSYFAKCIAIFLLLLNSFCFLTAQPYSCGGAFPAVPNPGTNDIAAWSGGVYNATNFVNYFNGDFKNGWNTLYGVTLNDFPFTAASAPIADDNLLSQWIIEGIRFMFYGNSGATPFDWDYAPKLSHAALCDAACIDSRFVPGQNPATWVHQCVSDTSPFNDWVIMLNEPFGTNWHIGLSAENVVIAADNGETSTESIFQSFVAWVGIDGLANNGHFVPIFSCSQNLKMVTGIGVFIGNGNRITVWQRLMDLTGQQSAAPFWQGTSTCSFILPVELVNFEVRSLSDCGKVALNWQTSSETNNDYFTIERSTDKTKWTPLTHIEGAGNSYQQVDYRFVDEAAPSFSTLYYRLKQTDFDGKFEYSSIRTIRLNCGTEDIHVYPNPFTNELFIDTEKDYPFTIFNSLGEIIWNGITTEKNGVNWQELPNGIYTLIIEESGVLVSQKLIKI